LYPWAVSALASALPAGLAGATYTGCEVLILLCIVMRSR
jgi:hypothetical protein